MPYENPLSQEEKDGGWITLFDGHSLFGWTSNAAAVNWHVTDGAITASEGPRGLLLTSVPFADFEFTCEFQLEAGGNSGVFLRTIPQPAKVDQDCYELNIVDAHPDGYLTGSLVGRARTAEPITGSGDWKTCRVVAEGRRFQVFLGGEQVLDFTDDTDGFRPAGHIGLQRNEGAVSFRNLRLRPLGMHDLFNGTDLTGWRIVPGSKSEFAVEDGTIHVTNGAGFLETEPTFGNFIFQAASQTHAAELNSGYFFRAMPGTAEAPSNGYEAQIHNGFDGDRHHPNNAGTGAIFRRVEARYVVPNDNEWFTTTLIANGPRIAVWVDGYQVVDWEDTRKSDENPRKGQRLAAGHISLQGHDPTTDISFKSLRAVELPAK
ncbi:MAG: DUF1080 domain-containing protein [Planctomycetaceae bacterium]|nr:DUF1080 domain-containing protein [Planctomycetaceae bacterium]